MRRIDIDFAPHTLQRAVLQTPLSGWLILLVASALWIVIGITASNLIEQKKLTTTILKQVATQEQSQLAAQNAKKQANEQFTIPESQELAVNQAIEQLNLPWRDLFDALESATPRNIALLTIEPDAKKHVVKATAEAIASDDMIAYIEQLKKQPLFKRVLLSKHEINEQDPNKPVRFQIEAEWIEAVP